MKKSRPGMPLVTVITVVYNGAAQLEETILSVLGQSYDNIEYIIIDGGSTDGTLDVIRKYDDSIAYWSSEPDHGLYDAMNKGIDAATGEWINFMNAGDRFYENDTVEQVMSGSIADADLLYGHRQMVYSPDFALIWRVKNLSELWKGMIFSHQSLFTRRSVFTKLRFDLDYRIGADFNFIYASYRNGYRFKSADVVIASVSAGGVSDVNLVRGIQECWRSVARFDDTLKVNCYYRWSILLTYLKRMVKRILPSKIENYARSIKHR